MTMGQYAVILTPMVLCLCHETDAAVPVLVVVPVDEIPHPAACSIQVGEALFRSMRAGNNQGRAPITLAVHAPFGLGWAFRGANKEVFFLRKN